MTLLGFSVWASCVKICTLAKSLVSAHILVGNWLVVAIVFLFLGLFFGSRGVAAEGLPKLFRRTCLNNVSRTCQEEVSWITSWSPGDCGESSNSVSKKEDGDITLLSWCSSIRLRSYLLFLVPAVLMTSVGSWEGNAGGKSVVAATTMNADITSD